MFHQINDLQDNITIKVRIISQWKQPLFKDRTESYSLDLIVIDEEGQRIQACVARKWISKYEHLLKDGDILYLSNLGVVDNEAKFKMTTHRFKLNFTHDTMVTKCSDFAGPMFGFSFLNFENIVKHTQQENVAFDVIGELVSCGQILVPSDGKKKSRISFEIADLKGLKVKVTLWDEFARQLSDYITSVNMKGHVIIVLLLAKVKYFNGQGFVSNSFYGSKLFIDSGIDEVTNFRNSLIESKGDDTSTHKIRLLSSRPYSIRDEFLTITTRRNIDDLREMMELSKTCSSIVIGTIKCVQQDVPWYYLGCSKCPRKVNTVVLNEENGSGQVRETFQCTKCKEPVIVPVPRFMLPLRIQDTTGSASLTLFDFDASKILNKTASEIVERLHEDGDMDMFPHEFNVLVGKKFAFKVDITDYNLEKRSYVYTVSKITNDEQIMLELENKYPVDKPAETESLNPAFGDYSNQGSLSI